MTDRAPLFQPAHLGAIEIPHRVLMAPLTRNRAHADGAPREMAVEYYRQRAGAGLIFTEATQISAMGKGYIDTPGIHEDGHVAGWRAITDAVRAAGGRIAVQLWHVGRISHVSLLPGGAAPVAPSAIRAEAKTFGPDGFVDTSTPRALETDEIPALIEDYRRAARRAMDAGFDGVEVHAANGYLLDQFLHAHSNARSDAYGGSPENRARLPREVVEAVAAEIGADRVGVRLSPTGRFNDMTADEQPTFEALIDALDGLGLAWLHMVEKFPGADVSEADVAQLDALRPRWSGAYVANGDFDADLAAEWIAAGKATAVAFGRPYIANPDLAKRYRLGAPLNEPDDSTFYGGGAEGYTDYPALADAA